MTEEGEVAQVHYSRVASFIERWREIYGDEKDVLTLSNAMRSDPLYVTDLEAVLATIDSLRAEVASLQDMVAEADDYVEEAGTKQLDAEAELEEARELLRRFMEATKPAPEQRGEPND